MECAASEHAKDPRRYGADAFTQQPSYPGPVDRYRPMTTKDVDEAIAKLKATAAKTPPGEWLL